MATGRKPYEAMPPNFANRPMDRLETTGAFMLEESESASASASHPAIWLDSVSISARIPPRVTATSFLAKPTPPPVMSSSSQGAGCSMSRALIEQHRPWDVVDHMVLIIIDQTYAAALGIPGRRELTDGSVEVRSAVDANDPDSPVLTINASATRCCVAIDTSRCDAVPYKKFTSPKMKTRPDHRLARSIVSVSSGTLYLSLRSDDGGDRKDYWSCAEVAPDVAAGGALAILDTIMLRLKTAIHLQENILVNAREFNCDTTSSLEVVIETRNALEEMRSEIDLPAMMQRRRHKRRHVVGDGRPAAAAGDQDDESAEKVFKKFRTMRCR